jgi:membrane protease YdiL (CAAX protease family)
VPSGFDTGGPAAALVGAVTAAGLLFPATRRLYADDRITGQTHDETIYQALVRIPLGTALGEEAIFRGSLPALLARRFPSPVAGALAAGLFGLWHIVPTIDRLNLSPWTRDTGPFHRTVSTMAVVSFTSAAGVAFWILRAASNSVVAPTLAHASANSVALAGGWFAHRMQNEADGRAARIRGTPDAH